MRRLLVLAVVLLLPACAGSDGTGSDPNNPDQVEVLTWWTAGAEKRGFDAMTAVFADRNPALEVIDASVGSSGGDAAQAAIAARLAAGNPPDSFQATAGAGLLDYVEQSALRDLSGFYRDHHLDAAFRDTFLDLLRVDGAIYSVPVAIHRTNIVWSNSGLLEEAGVDPAATRSGIDYWLDDLQRLRDAGVDYPLALGEEWTQVQLFENVLLADLGPVVYKTLWSDSAAWEDVDLARVIDQYAQLLDYVDPDSAAEDSAAAVHRVVNGDAAYVVIIDTVTSSFQQAASSGHRYGAFPVAGTNGVFAFSVDAFTQAADAAHPAATESWLLSLSSVEGQQAFALEAGAIPARIDADDSLFPAYQQAAIESLRTDTVAPSLAHGVAADPRWAAAIADAVVRFRHDHRPQALRNALLDAATAAHAAG